MKRLNFYLTEQQIAALEKISKDTGLNLSELIRRAVDLFIKKVNK